MARNDAENLEALDQVIKLLEPTEEGAKPISKKEACAILRISYNTTRLTKLIEAHKEKRVREAAQRAAKRGTPATAEEIKFIISGYLTGDPVSELAAKIYRSASFVNKILEDNSVPVRQRAHDYFKPELIPENAVRTRFAVGELVYSARYDSVARVETEQLHKSGQYVYRLWLLADKWLQSAYQEACEIASLEHLIKLGVKL